MINGKRRRPKIQGLKCLSVEEAKPIFFVAIDTFKRHRQFSRFIVSTPTVKRAIRGVSDVVARLEEFRCNAIGMENVQLFYQMVAEFTLVPNSTKYYQVVHLFAGLETTDEFMSRVFDTLMWIFDIYDAKDIPETKIVWLADQIKQVARVFESGIERKHKDWYCLSAILRLLPRKGWSEEEFLRRVKVWYRHRVKKVTGEMILFDLTHGSLDHLEVSQEKPKKKLKMIDTLTSQEGYKDWVKQVHENKITFEYDKREED